MNYLRVLHKICSLDCHFVCSFEPAHDLTDYHLLNQIELILNYSEHYESTKKDRVLLKIGSSGQYAVSSITESYLDEDELVAAISMYKQNKKRVSSLLSNSEDKAIKSMINKTTKCVAAVESNVQEGNVGLHFV